METPPLKYWPLTTPKPIYKNHKVLRQVKASLERRACLTQSEICSPMIYPSASPQMYRNFGTDTVRSQMKLKVSAKNSALTLADIIIYCPNYRLASALDTMII